MRSAKWAALSALAALSAACGGRDDGPRTDLATPNPEDPGFAAVSRSTGQGTTFWIGPVSGGRTPTPDSEGLVQVGRVTGQGQAGYSWTGRRALQLCAAGRTVEGPASATVGGQTFTIERGCGAPRAVARAPATQAPIPGGGQISAFAVPPAGAPGATPESGPATGPDAAPPVQSRRAGLPPRRPGLWVLTTITDGEHQQSRECLTPQQARDWSPDPEQARQCGRSSVIARDGAVIGDAVCQVAPGQLARMHAEFTGEFETAYEGQITLEISGPDGPVLVQSRARAEWQGPCGPS